ncbi:MAG: tetratricopeptide repeat protein [Alphaproteobacteria bacterium]|nr:tetratricopeptide repeat protein [Alphaproteobacteria bacterium]
MTDELLREVDEDIRRERYERLWQRYGSYVIAAAIGIVGLTAGVEAYRQYGIRQSEALSERYVLSVNSALRGDDPQGAIRALAALAADTTTGYSALARLQQAALIAKLGDLPGALEIYDSVAGDRSMPPALRELAVMLGALNAVEREDATAIERRVVSINVATSPWRFSAREAIALAALRAGDMDRARGLLRALADDFAAPSGVRGRAAELLAALDA